MKKSWPFFRSDSPAAKEADTGSKRKLGGWKCMPYIIGNETFEKVASIGLMANFTVYLVKKFHMEQVVATQLTNIYAGTTNFAPLFGAFISDAYCGRFRTLAFTSIVSFLGMIVLMLTAIVPQFQPPSCTMGALQASHCPRATKGQFGVLILSLVLLTIGGSGIRPCSLPFGVDQFDRTTEQGRRGLNSYFNWYYCTTTTAVLLALTVLVYIQDSISWAVGFGIPVGLMFVSIVMFFLGTRLYEYVPPEGSVFSSIAQVFVAAVRKRQMHFPVPNDLEEPETLLYNSFTRSERITKLSLTRQFKFLNKAAIKCEGEVNPDGSIAKPWHLCSIQQIEEVKCLLRIIPIWSAGIISFLAAAQQWTFTILQALTMDRNLGPHFQVPAASVGALSLIGVTFFVPIYDQLLIPTLRKITKTPSGITLLQRQGIGLVISALSMIVAGLVEQKRRTSALAHNGISPMSALLYLSPQLLLMGIAESFNAIGQIEFYNRQFPEHMQALASALFFCSVAGSNYLSTMLVSIIKRNTGWLNNDINLGKVDYFYYIIAGLGMVNFAYFLVCAHFYRYKEEDELKKVIVELTEE